MESPSHDGTALTRSAIGTPQPWAWAAIWLGVDPIGLTYFAMAVVMALAQGATALEFFGAAHA